MDPRLCPHATVEDGFDSCSMVCMDCGLVLQDYRLVDTEWRATQDDTRIRCDEVASDTGKLAFSNVPSALQHASSRVTPEIRNEKSFRATLEQVDVICTNLGLASNVCDAARNIMIHVRTNAKDWRATRRPSLVAASISIAIQSESAGVSDTKLMNSPLVRIPARALNKQKKLVLQLFHESGMKPLQIANAGQYSMNISNQLGMSRQIAVKISRTCQRVQRYVHMKSKPCSTVVACGILLYCEKHGMRVDRERLGDLCHVTTTTVLKWYADATGRSVKVCRTILQKIMT